MALPPLLVFKKFIALLASASVSVTIFWIAAASAVSTAILYSRSTVISFETGPHMPLNSPVSA